MTPEETIKEINRREMDRGGFQFDFDTFHDLVAAIREAVSAERERCAKVAEREEYIQGFGIVSASASAIAATIRALE